ncbi:fibronectin type III domain-containing protein [Peptacetobacter hiranonis]|uniref:fibronectin type III domain-containing protein n=1 Tax=Peptacetobacter hiranonis TaxID=89152 RepID=UPI00191724B2|nr:fibronectin type III domain-containing protein [Peptacetobacter hiranonis]QQQ87622.1 fibronectin type III domain-containing protein [Peptacetobacter hiranonis]
MKKVISGALAAAIITSNLPLRVLAEEVNPIVDSTDSKEENTVERTGYIEVDINLDMPIYNNKDRNIGINVDLKANDTKLVTVDGENLSGNFKLGDKECSYIVEPLGLDRSSSVGDDGKVYAYRVTFKDLPASTGEKYKIALSGYGFSNVESEEIEINNYSKRIVVNNAGKSRDTKGESLFPIGDVNHDGEVNYTDYNKVFEHLGSMDREYDLNRDKSVDISDLQYVHDNMGRHSTKELKAEDSSFILDSKVIENVEATSNDGTVTGEVKNILDDSREGILTIQSKNNGEITENAPVSLDLNLNKDNVEQPEISMQYLSIVGNIKSGSIIIDGEEIKFDENGNIEQNLNRKSQQATERTIRTTENTNNNIVINLGKQVAVSKITIKVTGTNDRNLAKIAKVEFLNNVYKENPKPEIIKPEITAVSTSTATGNEYIDLTWKSEDQNITGYELKVEEIDTNGNVKGSAKKFRMTENNFKISGVRPYSSYRLSVQALNGKWESGYNELKEEDKAKIDNVDVNDNYNPVKDEVFKERGKDGIVNVAVIPNDVPTPPEGIKAEGKYKSIELSWKNHYAAKEFEVYYRIKGSNSEFELANKDKTITGTSYTITGLEDNTLYEIQMRAKNHKGFGKMSESVSVRTVQATAPETPNYKLINTISEGTGKTNNIKDVKYPKITIPEGKENEKIEYGTGTDHIEISNKYAVVDNDYTTYWSVDDWDTGASYTNNRRGPIVEFDFLNKKEYKINKIAVVSRVDGKGNNPNGAKVFVYENGEANSKSTIHEASIQNYTDSKNSKYSIIKLNEPITVKEGNLVQVSLSTSSQANPKSTSIAELKFYEYDPIEDNIKDLFADDLHLVLKDDVTESKIALLRKELQKKDNGEYHPEKEALEKELDIALKLLKEANSLDKDVTTMDISINGGGTNTGYGNDWQALGLTAKAGDTIKVYVSKTIADGSSNREIYLGYEQNYAESGSYISKQIELKSGENIIQIDKLVSTDVEKGGNLYVRIGGQPDTNSETVKIRVSGAEKIPHLNLNNKLINVNELVNKKDSDDVSVKEIKEELKTYIKELKNHVDNLPKKHKQSNIKHEEVGDKDNIYDYNPRTSILNSTNIEGDRFTLTIPATQAYKGLGLSNLTDENIDEKVDKLYDTMLAWEQLIQITNAKKGVLEKDNGSGIYANNKASRQRVNVKYQRMFGSAFMYASGHHVGVEYDSTSDFMNGVPYKFKDGKVTNPGEGYLFGWGISHEIGHKADIGDRTYGETSNNILALMTQTFDGVSKSRLELNNIYPKIYKKVTSATEGVAQDVATLLGMFWQLHLAYEPGYTYEILDRNNDKDLTNDSYYTKMNRLYRNRTAEEKTIKDKDQLLIVMASKAAGKDLTDFFDSWGIKITSETKDILDKLNLPKEERKIQYLNDEAYRKRLAGVGSISKEDTKVVASFKDESIKNTVLNSNSVTLSLNIDNEKNKDKILGYEIIRNDGNTQGNENEGTKVNYRSVGFVNANEDGSAEFTDNISPMNNRAVTYKVKAYDYNLNYTKEYEVGSVKLSHDGTLDSSKFLLKSNLISEELIPNEDGEVSNSIDQNSELAWKNNDALAKMTDGKNNTAFRGKRMTYNAFDNSAGSSNEDKIDINADPYVIFDLQGSKTICGFKYTKSDNAVSRFSLKRLVNAVKGNTTYNPISQYRMYISNDGKNWTEINKTKDGKPNEFKFGGSNTTKVIFEKEDKNIRSYEAKYVKLVAVGAKDSYLDIAEISLLGSTGDNIEIQKDGIGKLKEDFVYQKQNEEGGLKEATIPAGSIIITGEYKGNPGFNIPLLIDDDNKTINGEAIMMAELSDEGEVGEIYSGRWIYWVSENDLSKLSSKVKAELYRYNGLDEDDNVSEEQRLVSDTLYNTVPSADKLPTIELKSEVQRMARKSSKQNNVTYIDMRNSNSNK